jgi:hypothetical protein
MTQDEFTIETLRRLPVAASLLSVFAVICSEERMAKIFSQHRGRSYEDSLSFHDIVKLMFSAVLEHNAVGRKAFNNARKHDDLAVSNQAVYGKLRRMPQALSHALVHESIPSLLQMFPESVTTQVPACFNDYNIYGIDGKKLKDIAKRLKETRGTPGKLLGGKTLVALSIHERLVVAMNSSLDGEANDGPLVPGLLESLSALTPTNYILLADSQFCDLTTPKRILAYGWGFVVRYHPKVHFHIDPEVKSQSGKDSRGRQYVEEIGWLGKPGSKSCIRVRRITVTRDGKPDVIIVTSLLDTTAFNGSDILDLYALRWTIETVFLHITKEFDLRHMIGSTAEATIFQFSMCLLLYNTMILIQTNTSDQKGIAPEELSLPKIMNTAKSELSALAKVADSSAVAATILNRGPAIAKVIKGLRNLWDDDWIKAPKNNRKPKPPPTKKSGAHTSVQRQIDAYYANQ